MKNNPVNSEIFREQVTHGNQDFQLQLYKDMEYHEKGLILYNHWHEEAEIFVVTEGAIELVVDGISIFAEKNTVVLIPPNLLHSAYQYQNQKCRFTSIVFHADFIASKNPDIIQTQQLDPFFDNTFISSYVLSHAERKNETVQLLLGDLIHNYSSSEPYRELIIKGCLYQILYHLLQKEKKHNLKSVSDYVNEERKKKILSFMEANYQNPLNLNELATAISLSKEQFCRFFKHSFRTTPIHYLNKYRINRSMDLLKETSKSIIEIAIEVGFDSSNYFSVSFKKATGMTPSQFRKMT